MILVLPDPCMLRVRSRMTTRSTGTVGAAPQGPLHTADTTVPDDPLFIPTTGARA